MISFKNDYSEGAHPKILEALMNSNFEQTDGYGEDYHTKNACRFIKEKMQWENCNIYFLVGGTQANLTVISHILRPYEAVIASDTGHIGVHETGAIEATGHKVIVQKSQNGKLTPELIKNALEEHTDLHMVHPKMVYISNPTEVGTLYNKRELEEIRKICSNNKLYLYIDGARMSSALASETNDVKLSDYPRLSDVFYIGGTKGGALFGEAVVITNENIAKNFGFSMKQKGALLAKGRMLGIQFEQLFTDSLYTELGKHANKMAELIKTAISIKGYKFLYDSYTNQQFPILPDLLINKLSEKYDFILWKKMDKASSAIRLVTSWATREEDVLKFINDFNHSYV